MSAGVFERFLSTPEIAALFDARSIVQGMLDFEAALARAQAAEGVIPAQAAAPTEGPVAEFAATCGTDAASFMRDRPGMSAFALEDGVVYHTYSTYARGVDGVWGMYQWLDRAPLGRNESGIWFRRHDEYGSNAQNGGSCCQTAEAHT